MAFTSAETFAAYERLEMRKRMWFPQWTDVSDFVIPRKGNLFPVVEGQKRTQRLFESTAINSNELLAASLQGSLTSPIIQWFSLRMRDDRLNKDRLTLLWLDTVAKVIYAALSQSNFSSEIFEVYLDLGSFGTSALFIEEMPGPNLYNGILFDSWDIGEYVFDENKEGFADSFFRTIPLSARNAFKFFGKDASKLSDKIKDDHEEKPDELHDFVHVVYPREDSNRRRPGYMGMPFASCWYEKQTKGLIREHGYPEFPACITRWLKTSGELWGRSPAITAMPDIKSLNRARQMLFRAWSKAIDPAMIMLDDGIIGNIKLGAGQINVARSMEALAAIKNEGRFDVSQLEEEKLRQGVRRIFYTDQLQMPDQGPQMTATEVQIRFELMQRLLGPTFGRMMSELLSPLIRRVYGILARGKMLPPPPPALEKQNIDIELVFEGPLSRAQRSQDVLAVERWFTVNAPLFQVDPTIIDVIEPEEIARDTGQVLGMRPNWIAGDDSLAQKKQVRAKQQQAALMQEVAQTAGDLAAKTAPMVKNVQTAAVEGAIPPQGEGVESRLDQLLGGGI